MRLAAIRREDGGGDGGREEGAAKEQEIGDGEEEGRRDGVGEGGGMDADESQVGR